MIKRDTVELNTKEDFDDYAIRIAHLQLIADSMEEAYPKELTLIAISAMKFFYGTWSTVYNMSKFKDGDITDSYNKIYKSLKKSDET